MLQYLTNWNVLYSLRLLLSTFSFRFCQGLFFSLPALAIDAMSKEEKVSEENREFNSCGCRQVFFSFSVKNNSFDGKGCWILVCCSGKVLIRLLVLRKHLKIKMWEFWFLLLNEKCTLYSIWKCVQDNTTLRPCLCPIFKIFKKHPCHTGCVSLKCG